MTSCTDPLGLNEKKLFQDFKNNLPKLTKETTNILKIRDDILYLWHAEKCCILTLDIAAVRAKKEDVPYQSLQPTDPPIFEVSQLLINETATQLVLWGSLGVVVLQLPKRWGKKAQFQGGKQTVSCLSHNLDDCYSQLSRTEVRQVRWHPGSSTDSHLLLLASDNVFQLYECEIGQAVRLTRTWKVGPSLHSPAKLPGLSILGDAAVDFDFASPSAKPSQEQRALDLDKLTWRQIEWPILVLRGSGDVLIVRGNVLIDHNKPVVFGTLSMYPPAVDNYGLDSCSIMCLQTTPPLVAIASSAGKIYHALLLSEGSEDDDDERKSWSQYGSTYSLHTPEEALYVYECVELELGLFYTDSDKKYSCPIHLHADPENRSRYFCSHNAGIHLVNVPMVSQLEQYVAASEATVQLQLANLVRQSSAQYLLSTRTKYTGREEATPVLGFGLLQEPCILVALLHTGLAIDISVIDSYYIPSLQAATLAPSPSKKVFKESFDGHIKQLLMRDTSQPITAIGLRKNLTSRECLELLYRATTVFRKQHFLHHDQVREEFRKQVRTLKASKAHQLAELEHLSDMKKRLQQKVETLAERYEDIKDKQEELARRAEEVLRLVYLKEPNMNPIERAEAEQIKSMSEKVKELHVRLEQLKKKKAANQTLFTQLDKTAEYNKICLKPAQIDAITTNLDQMGKDIAELINRAKLLQEQVGL
ncbi:nuclear pore complex protein Nup88 [Phymastichus coffea]|uniref:nuclear pore complex protein Nup88 n=1 Tax=Phymastichus coffea TaxID=108790 RepID=UPI00273B1917|nr:nuclear pore complex protein Nup88 [Phymastichus coffea]